MKFIEILTGAFAIVSAVLLFTGNANATVITMYEETAPDYGTVMEADIQDIVGGVTVDYSFTASSVYTGDITGIWLGYDESVTGHLSIGVGDISVLTTLPADVSYTVTLCEVDPLACQNLGGGVNLNGVSGYALIDLDIGLAQNDPKQNDIISDLTIQILSAGLNDQVVNAIGARVQSLGPDGEFSAKLVGTTVSVPEPTPLALMGLGLVGLGFSRRRKLN